MRHRIPAYFSGLTDSAQHQDTTKAMPGTGRNSALRMALQNGNRSRRSTEASVEEVQRRRDNLTDEALIRRRDSATASWDCQAPAQPRECSPVTRPISVRQRQTGMANFPPGLSMFPARRRNSVYRDDYYESRATDEGAEIDGAPVRGTRSPAQSKTTLICNEVKMRGAFGTCSGSSRGNNQTEDAHMTPPRYGTSSNVPERAASSPSDSPYLEPDFSRYGNVARRGRCGRRTDHDTANCYDTPKRTLGTGRVAGGTGGVSDGVRSSTCGKESIRRGRVRPAPSTAPFVCESDRLPSIDGVETSVEERGGCGGENPLTAVGRRRDNSEYPTTSEERRRPGGHSAEDTSSQIHNKEKNDNYYKHKTAVGDEISGVGRSGSWLIPGEREASDGDHSVAAEVCVSGVVATTPSRRGHGLQTRRHTELAGSSGGGAVGEVGVDSFTGRGERLVGLQNLGNTCFMNACLQCLLHTDCLVDLFRRHVNEQWVCRKSRTQGALAMAFGELLRLIEASPAYSNVSPSQVKHLVDRFAPHLSGYGQHDCQEFLRFFLDGLSEDLNRRGSGEGAPPHKPGKAEGCRQSAPLTPPPLTEEALARLSADQQADRAWALHLGRNDSDITSMFCGQLHSRISCLTCGNVSHCFDPFFDLSLPLPRRQQLGGSGGSSDTFSGGIGDGDEGGGGATKSSCNGLRTGLDTPGDVGSMSPCKLEDCLRVFTMKETLEGDNRPMCARCRRRRKSAKCLAVHRFPPVLVVHLKRFRYDSTSREKLSTAVEVPIAMLDLAPFSTSGARLSGYLHRPNHLNAVAEDHSAGSRRRRDSLFGSWDIDSPRDRREIASRSSTGSGKLSIGGVAPVYELYGVCNHVGGLKGGHYTAQCKVRPVDSDGGGWHTFDDSRVSGGDAIQIGRDAAYVLFYRLAVAR